MSSRSKILVALQFVCFLYFFIRGEMMASGILLFVQLLGLILGLWSIWAMKIGNLNIQPEVKRNAVFVSSGPYRIIRNPMYAALIIFFGAIVISFYNTLNLSVFILLILILLLKINMEEQFLTSHFKDTYAVYKKKTWRLVPYLF